MDKEYLDVKFDGLEKLMKAENANLKEYVKAVSTNVKEVRGDLAEHEKSADAHGAGAVSRGKTEWIAIAVAVLTLGTLAVDIYHRR